MCVSSKGEIALNAAAAVDGRAVLLRGGSGGALLALMRPWCVPPGRRDPLCFSLPGGTVWLATLGVGVSLHPDSPGVGQSCFGGLEKNIRSKDLVFF